MSLHEESVGKTDEWYTPAYVFSAMGKTFDIDVAAPRDQKFLFVPAFRFLSENSLDTTWNGFIWMNPPFGGRNGIRPWLQKFMAHGDGVALTPDRTSAPWWQEAAKQADSILFVSGKIKFISETGDVGSSPAQGTTLMAKGVKGVSALTNARNKGPGILMRKI